MPTPIEVPPSSYQASITSLCHTGGLPLATGYADFDQDGRIDALTAEISGSRDATPIQLLIQSNSGDFEEVPSLLQSPPPSAIHPRKVVISDFNLDGHPDAFVADHGYDQPPFPGAQSVLLLSTGGGLQHAQISNMPTGFQHSASAADINGDGAPDVFVTDATNGSFFLVNDGSGNFSVTREPIPTIWHGYYSSELIDVDGDGYYDLLVGGHEHDGAVTRVFWGDEIGTFSLARSTPVPADPTFRIVLDFDAADLDGDGDSEVVLTRTKSSPFYEGYYFQLLDLAQREFTDISERIVSDRDGWIGNRAQWIAWLEIRDHDGDGDMDIVVPENDCHPVFINDGNGHFTRAR